MRVPRQPWSFRLALTAVAVTCCVLVSSAAGAAEPPAPALPKVAPAAKGMLRLEMQQWRIVDSQSGPVNYYTLLHDAGRSFVRGSYRPPHKKAVLGVEVPERNRNRARRLEWSWRPIKFPDKGDECVKERGDSPVVLYVTWRRFLRWYSIKYVWSTTRKPGTVCDRRRNAFVAQDTVVLQSGGPAGVWKRESIDLAKEFRAHFGEGDARAEVPPLMGLGVMTDGDQTKTESTGDFADFELSP